MIYTKPNILKEVRDGACVLTKPIHMVVKKPTPISCPAHPKGHVLQPSRVRWSA